MKSNLRARSNRRLIVGDLAQAEIRVMTLFSRDPLMMEVLNDPHGDIHQTTADKFHVPRNPTAKQLNFLLLYGGGAYMLANKLTVEGVPTDEHTAKSYLDQYNSTYHGVRTFRENMFTYHRQHGYFPNLVGRRRSVPNLDSPNYRLRHSAETTLANNTIQSSAQDWIKATIIRCDPRCTNPDAEALKKFHFGEEHKKIIKGYVKKLEDYREMFRKYDLRWLLQVHDELMFEVLTAGAEKCMYAVADIMTWRPFFEPVIELCVPMRVEVGVGYTWRHAKGKKPLMHCEA